MALDLSGIQLPVYGWATAVVTVVVCLYQLLALFTSTKEHREKTLARAEEAYRKAVYSRDPRAIAVAARRLHRARKALGAS